MRRVLLTGLIVFSVAAVLCTTWRTACAAGTEVAVGAEIYIKSAYQNNADFDDNAKDDVAFTVEEVTLIIKNKFTEEVSTTLEMEAAVIDSANGAVEMKYAYIDVGHFFTENLKIRIGKIGSKWELRKNYGVPNACRVCDFDLSLFPDTKPLGILAEYVSGDITVNLLRGQYLEGSVVGNNANDIDEYLLRVEYNTGKGYVNGYLLYWNDNNSATPIDYFTIGFAGRHAVVEGKMGLWADISYQTGNSTVATDEFGALRAWVGTEVVFESETKPMVGLDLFYLQGASGNTKAYTQIKHDFDRTLIVESTNWIGFLPRANQGYTSVQGLAGLQSIFKGKCEVMLTFTYFTANGDLPAGQGKGIGTEVDGIFVYNYMENLSFVLGVAWFTPDKDFAGASNPDPTVLAIFNAYLEF
ncbi:MAG: hypothetical protein WC712_00285 [Candidatus Brocadiia bacterium]